MDENNHQTRSFFSLISGISKRITSIFSVSVIGVSIAATALYFQINDSMDRRVEINEEQLRKATRLQTPELSTLADLSKDSTNISEFLLKNRDNIIKLDLYAPWPEDYNTYDGMPLESYAENYLLVGKDCDFSECSKTEITFSGDCQEGYCSSRDSAGQRHWDGYAIVQGTGYTQGTQLIALKMIPQEEARLRK